MFKFVTDLCGAVVSLTGNLMRLSNTVARLDAEINDALPSYKKQAPIPIEARDGGQEQTHTTNGFVEPPKDKRRRVVANNGE